MWFGDKALVVRATVGDDIHYCQLPKELENRVNDFNNLHNPIFEFLVLRQGRASACPVGKLAVMRYINELPFLTFIKTRENRPSSKGFTFGNP